MDFFSGSATTAHAVMKLNASDGGHRKFIMIQLPEKTPENSEARRAGDKLKAAHPHLDTGFKVFKVVDTNR